MRASLSISSSVAVVAQLNGAESEPAIFRWVCSLLCLVMPSPPLPVLPKLCCYLYLQWLDESVRKRAGESHPWFVA